MTVSVTTGQTLPDQELLDLIPKLKAMPGEDSALMADFRQALILDLAPSTPYEHSLAEQIFNLEWEAYRHRRMRDALIRTEIRQQSMGVFLNGTVSTLPTYDKGEKINAAEKLGYDLVSDDPERQQKALEKLTEHEITPDEVLAKSYRAIAKDLEIHETRIAETEYRCRRLRNDYDKAKTAAKPVEDAVLIEGT